MATLPSPPVHIDLWTILSESKRIINAHSRHFLALSVLFLLPLSFSISAYPAIIQLVSRPSPLTVETHLSFFNPIQQQPPNFPVKTLIFFFLYTLFTVIFSLFATGSITYSVFHGFYGRPVKLVSAINWGLEPLKRSKNLVKGMKGVAFSMILFFGFVSGIFSWGSAVRWGDADADNWRSWAFVLDIVVTSTALMMLMLYNLAASTVFYMYSKAIHGELAGEIAEEFAREYVSLPFDDGKIPHVSLRCILADPFSGANYSHGPHEQKPILTFNFKPQELIREDGKIKMLDRMKMKLRRCLREVH
ncbi:hypothetical protein QQP08_007337 [Theobroma cacao]|nr:hypothetical protein QQP08_007337 [Theobroma cacao]